VVKLKRALSILFVLFLVLCALPAMKCKIAAQADSWIEVGPSGDFPTIQQAINNASDGATIFVHNGTYPEDIIVNKSVSLIGENKDFTIIQGNRSFNLIYIRAGNVTISNFTMRKTSPQIVMALSVTSGNNVIRHNRIVDNYYGIGLYSSSNNVISDNNISDNQIGVSAYLSNNNTFSDNVITNNEGGITLASSNYNVLSGNALLHNGDGLSLSSSSKSNILYHNNFYDTIGVSNDSSNTWDSGGEGNYWINYSGQDLNADGIGDEPYPVGSNNRDNYPLMGTFSDHSVILRNVTNHVITISNHSISALRFETGRETGNRILHFNASDGGGSVGFCRIMIPTELMGYPFIVVDGEEEVTPTLLAVSNVSHAYLYLTYVPQGQMITIISSVTLRYYNELFEKYLQLQSDFYDMNVTYYGLLDNYSASLQMAINDLNTTYRALLNSYSSGFQSDINDLNLTYHNLMDNYNSLAHNYTQLQQDYLALNSSYREHLSDFSESMQNLRNIAYIFAATTAIFLATVVYLSKVMHGRKQSQD
jgi:parallel beta-helix repeat protein